MDEQRTDVAPTLIDDLWQQAVDETSDPAQGLHPDPDEVWVTFQTHLVTCGLELTTRPIPVTRDARL